MGDVNRFQPKCYHLSPEYADSFWGRNIYIYQGCGSLELLSDRLSFQSRRLDFDIPVAAIIGIGMGAFARSSKPFGLLYLTIRFEQSGKEFTVYLVPAVSALAPTWQTSRLVKSWFETLRGIEILADRIDFPLPELSDPRSTSNLGVLIFPICLGLSGLVAILAFRFFS